ncbi:MAG: hypothetical protein J6W10_07235, partial [Kiritimatiellae bacterium]|nr:hypothetical protein [Kiritimatiellia bacterium]
MKKLLLVAVLAGCFAGLRAETVVTVTNMADNLLLDLKAADYRMKAETAKQTQYPSELGEPLFWFDCSETNGWTFAANGEVAKIPNLVNDGRYLATDTEGGIHKVAWTSKNPVFVENDAVLGAPVLDFGVKGSRRGMCFNKVGPEGCETNILDGIGTVIAVWYSSMGSSTYGGLDGKGTGDYGEGGYYGGAVLGGGFGSDQNAATDKSGYVLYRGIPNVRQFVNNEEKRPRWYDNPIANNGHTHISIRWGNVRHNGQNTDPVLVGFAGGWEVVSILPKTNLLFNATGIGMNDSRIGDVSGGFKVAEMIIFGKMLNVFEAAKVEDYLQYKWLGHNRFGVNGNALLSRIRAFRWESGISRGAQLPVEVDEAEKLTIGELRGGRGYDNPSIVKTGAGKLEILDSSRYDGEVRIEEGTLEFTARQLPQSLPADPYLHFDASSEESFVTNSAGEFVMFKNIADKAVYKMHEIFARPSGETLPEIFRDEFGPGMHALDFGDYVQKDFNRALTFTTNETEAVSSVAVNLQNIVTVVALVGAQRGGGALLRRRDDNGYFARETVSPARFDVPFAGSTDNITAMIDALPINYKTSGYLHAGYQVIAVRTPGQDHSSGIGSLKKNNAGSPLGGGSGGLRLCEFVAYMRPLTDDEMCDASAFLMQKWLGKTAPGYRTVNAVNKVVAAGDVKINVENAVARIGELSKESGSLRKTGDGILEYQKTDFEEFSVAGGGVRKCKIQDVASVCELADGPALHLDVSDVKSMHGKTVDGERRVYEWYSKNDRSVMATLPFYFDGNRSAYGSDKYAPYLSSEVKLNGFDTLDFGPYSAAEGGRALSLSRSFDSVRSAYIVWTPRDDSRGNYFGCSKSNADGTTNGEYYDFLRSETATNSAQLVMENGTSQHVREGAIYTNGVKVSSSTVPKAGVFTLTEFHPAAAAHISGIGTDRDVVRLCGGIRVAEVVLYERKLSAREKVATRNYLMKKWFNSEPEALPEEDSEDDGFVKFAVMGDVSVDAADTIAIDRLIGEGQVEKSGEDELSIKELNGFTGTVAVTEGELKLVGRNLPDDGAIVAQDALIYHADATSGITAITNDNGKVEVVEWKSKLNDGWSAVPFYEDRKPTLVKADDLNGGYVVDMGMKGDKQAMLFVKNGETNLLDNIVTVFWMVGSHNGGGYLLGGGRHYSDPVGGRFNFMRGSSGGIGDKSEYPILNSNGSSWPVPYNLQNADWRKDGLEVDPKTEPLSGGWDLLSMRITYNQQPKTNADGFAFDGRTMVDGSLTTYMGSQRLAEVLIYNRKLTDEETRSVETYLARKWRFKGTSPEATNSVEVVLGDGTSLDLGGNRQYLAS